MKQHRCCLLHHYHCYASTTSTSLLQPSRLTTRSLEQPCSPTPRFVFNAFAHDVRPEPCLLQPYRCYESPILTPILQSCILASCSPIPRPSAVLHCGLLQPSSPSAPQLRGTLPRSSTCHHTPAVASPGPCYDHIPTVARSSQQSPARSPAAITNQQSPARSPVATTLQQSPACRDHTLAVASPEPCRDYNPAVAARRLHTRPCYQHGAVLQPPYMVCSCTCVVTAPPAALHASPTEHRISAVQVTSTAPRTPAATPCSYAGGVSSSRLSNSSRLITAYVCLYVLYIFFYVPPSSTLKGK